MNFVDYFYFYLVLPPDLASGKVEYRNIIYRKQVSIASIKSHIKIK